MNVPNGLIECIHAISSGQTPSADVLAQLTAAQAAPEAWEWIESLLGSAEPSLRFFAASTLAIKLARDFESAPSDHEKLRERTLQWLAQSADRGERAVLRKLSVSLHPAWSTWLGETLDRLQSTPIALFEALIIILEETATAPLAATQRVAFDQRIRDSLVPVLDFIASRLPTAPSDEVDAALRCLSAALASKDVPDFSLERLFPLLLPLVAQPSTSIGASAVIEDMITQRAKFVTQPRSEQLLDLLAADWSQQLLQQAIEHQAFDDEALALVKLLIAVIEHGSSTLAQSLSSARTSGLLQRLIAISSCSGFFGVDEEVSEMTLSTWTTLYESIVDAGTVETAEARSIYAALAAALRIKARKPGDQELASWPADVAQRFLAYRQGELHDALLTWSSLIENLLSLATTQHADQELESTLFVLDCTVEGINDEREDQLAYLFDASILGRVPMTAASRRIARTALTLIGRLSKWLHHHQAQLLSALQFIVAGLQVDVLSQPAARALRKLCSACRVELGAHIASFAGLLQQLEGRIAHADLVKVLAATASVIEALEPHAALDASLSLSEPLISRLGESVEQLRGRQTSEHAIELVVQQLASISAVASGLSRPAQDVLDIDEPADASDVSSPADPRLAAAQQRLQSVVGTACRLASNESELVQAIGDLLKAATASHRTPLSIDPLVAFEMALAPSSLWLPIAAQLVSPIATSVKDHSERQLNFNHLVHTAISSCLSTLSDPSGDPELLQAFMHFVYELFRVSPIALATQLDLLASVINCCIAVVRQTQERVALQRTCLVLTSLIHEAGPDTPYSAAFRPLVLQLGRHILGAVLIGIAGAVPRSSVPALSEVVHAMVFRLPSQARLWLGDLCAQDGFPASDRHTVTTETKARFVQAVVASRMLRKVRAACEEFSLIARGLQGAYGSSTSSVL